MNKNEAEALLAPSGSTLTVRRLGFVYGDADGHLALAPKLYATLGAHPAQPISLVHHRDIATAVHLVLSGALDDARVNLPSLYSVARDGLV